MNRAGFLSLGARGGAAVAVAAMGAGLLVDNAAGASGPLADLDLAVARLAVASELLAIAFYTEAIASRQLAGEELKCLSRALFNEREHLAAVSQILSGAGQTPATADDFTITFPKGAFASRSSIARLGLELETAFVGAYLGAVDEFAPEDLKTTAARIAASESQHLGVFSGIVYGRPIGVSFPVPADLETTSDFLDGFLS